VLWHSSYSSSSLLLQPCFQGLIVITLGLGALLGLAAGLGFPLFPLNVPGSRLIRLTWKAPSSCSLIISSHCACLSALTLLGTSLPPYTNPEATTDSSPPSPTTSNRSLLLAHLSLGSLHTLSCCSTLSCNARSTLPTCPCPCAHSHRSCPPRRQSGRGLRLPKLQEL
jgi:hypothetical protein